VPSGAPGDMPAHLESAHSPRPVPPDPVPGAPAAPGHVAPTASMRWLQPGARQGPGPGLPGAHRGCTSLCSAAGDGNSTAPLRLKALSSSWFHALRSVWRCRACCPSCPCAPSRFPHAQGAPAPASLPAAWLLLRLSRHLALGGTPCVPHVAPAARLPLLWLQKSLHQALPDAAGKGAGAGAGRETVTGTWSGAERMTETGSGTETAIESWAETGAVPLQSLSWTPLAASVHRAPAPASALTAEPALVLRSRLGRSPRSHLHQLSGVGSGGGSAACGSGSRLLNPLPAYWPSSRGSCKSGPQVLGLGPRTGTAAPSHG